jgi:hypothetical protein
MALNIPFASQFIQQFDVEISQKELIEAAFSRRDPRDNEVRVIISHGVLLNRQIENSLKLKGYEIECAYLPKTNSKIII